MITKDNFKQVLETLGFAQIMGIYTRKYNNVDCELKVDFKNEKLIFPTEKGFQVNDETTSNFSHPENFVVFECVARLFEKGYRPEHIALEPRWSLGHGGKSGKADICVKNKDAVLEFLKRFEADAKCAPSGINSLTVENVIAESTENVRMYTAPTIPYNVEQHIRNLPEGRHHSAEKAAQAIILGIDLLPNQTIVNSHTKGLAA